MSLTKKIRSKQEETVRTVKPMLASLSRVRMSLNTFLSLQRVFGFVFLVVVAVTRG